MIRNIFLLSLVLSLFINCSTADSENTMTLSGQVKDLKKGTILLERFVDSVYVAIDSAAIYGDSNFELKQKLESPEILHLHLRLDSGNLVEDRVSFFAEPGEINLYTKLSDFSDARVEGSENHDLLLNYYQLAKRYQDRNLDLIVEEFNANKEGNDSLVQSVENKKIALLKSSYLATVNFALQNTEHEIAPFVMVYETPNIHLRYLDTVYNSLSDKVKLSIYGKELKSRIADLNEKE